MIFLFKTLLNIYKFYLNLVNVIRLSNVEDFYIINSTFYKTKDNLKNNLRDIWLKSFRAWESIFDDNKEIFTPIHNISFNYWIRGYAATKIFTIDSFKILFLLLRVLQYFKLTLDFIIQVIFKLLFPITVVNQSHIINDDIKSNLNSKTYITFFATNWKLEEFKNELKKITNEPLKLINLSILKTNIISYLFEKNKNKIPIINIYKIIFLYIFYYPYMMKYFSKLYNSLVIYYSIKKSKDLNSLDVLIKESYSLEMRAMCLAADSNSRDIYKIIFSEED